MLGKRYRDEEESVLACYLDLLYNYLTPTTGQEICLDRAMCKKQMFVQSDFCWPKEAMGDYDEVILIYKPEREEGFGRILCAMYKGDDGQIFMRQVCWRPNTYLTFKRLV